MSASFSSHLGPVRRFLTIGFFVCITLLVVALYLLNLRAQDTVYQHTLLRSQQSLEDYGQNIAQFLAERKNDLSVLAEAERVQKYLQEYDPSSPNAVVHPYGEGILNKFQYYNLRAGGEEGGYASLALMNAIGEEIVALHRPLDVSAKFGRGVPLVRTSSQMQISSGEKRGLSLVQPVVIEGKISGFVRGELPYESLGKRLTPSPPGLLILTNQRRIVYQSLPECQVSIGLLHNLVASQPSPVEMQQSSVSTRFSDPCIPATTHIYYTNVPGHDIQLYSIATDGVAHNHQQQHFFPSSFLFLTLCVLVYAGISHRLISSGESSSANPEPGPNMDKVLKEQSQTLELVLKGAQLGTWGWNVVTGELELNDRFFTMLGYTPGELPAHVDTWKSLLHSEDKEYVLPVLEAHLAGITPFYSTEHRLRHKAGHWVWVLDTGQVLERDNNGNPLRAFGVHLDVSERKDVLELRQAIGTIRQQKSYIEALFDVVSVGVVALSASNDIIHSNQAFTVIVDKWSRKLGLEIEDLRQLLIQGILSGECAEESFVYHLDRENFQGYFRCSVTRISTVDGIAIVLSVDDITRRRLAEEAKRFLATLIEQTGEAVLVTGTDGIIDYANPACCSIMGYMPDELVGKKVSSFTDGLIDIEVLAHMRSTLLDGQSWSGHLRSRKKDGSILEEETTISLILNNLGETTHYVSIWHDITELVELQLQLSKAQKMEAIGQLAAGIAHEINTPMQYVQNNVTFIEQSFEDVHGVLKLLQSYPPGVLPADLATEMNEVDLEFLLEEVPTSIEETLQGIHRVVKIVAAMKEFSHPGYQDKIPTNINHSLESTLIVCKNEWKYSAELVTDLGEDLPLVNCYVDQLHQALVNLVINATHAIEEQKQTTPETKGRLTVTTRQYEQGIEIRIGDNGPGIPESIRAKIYEPFFTTKGVGKGTGQGLAIAYDVIVNQHGGKIRFESSKGQGTTFILRLPV